MYDEWTNNLMLVSEYSQHIIGNTNDRAEISLIAGSDMCHILPKTVKTVQMYQNMLLNFPLKLMYDFLKI